MDGLPVIFTFFLFCAYAVVMVNANVYAVYWARQCSSLGSFTQNNYNCNLAK